MGNNIYKKKMDSNLVITNVLKPFNPYQIALFGSRARGNSKPTSDYDIMVFWKKNNFPKNKYETEDEFENKMYELANKLSKELKSSVDLVVMKYIGKWQNVNNDRDSTFYECVKSEAIYFKDVGGNELIDMSEKIGLFKIN